jgi:hypothetical protein
MKKVGDEVTSLQLNEMEQSLVASTPTERK